MTEGTLPYNQKARVALAPVGPDGEPEPIDGPIQFRVVSGDATLEPIDDLSTFVVPPDTAEDVVLEAKGDADLGAGFEPISELITIHFIHPKATRFGVTISGEPKTPPAPAAS